MAANMHMHFSGKLVNIVATRCQILRLKCIKFDFRWGSAPHSWENTALRAPWVYFKAYF